MRERAGIKAGDKLALVAWEKDGAFCCLTLIKANELGGMVKEKLGPLLAGLVRE
ncbi:MAG: HgcAB-associated protein [Candidatus Aminicenantes bacterium]|nr:HgcAB-associated protein [Candidatus Aminicenantes bacterium]